MTITVRGGVCWKQSKEVWTYPFEATEIVAQQVLCMHTKSGGSHTQMWDTDSYPIGVDNRCTACISHSIDDFVGSFQDTERTIRGFGGSTHVGIKKGTVKWSIPMMKASLATL